MPPPLIQVICSKGGVGKTLVCVSVIHLLRDRKREVFLLETDTTNPDVLQVYKDEIPHEGVDLSVREGWAVLADTLNEQRRSWVVLNGLAASQDAMLEFSRHFWTAAKRSGRKVISLWVINRNNDAVALLDEYLDAVPADAPHALWVVKNLYYARDGQFPVYDHEKSEVRKRVEEMGGAEVAFPVMADRNAAYIYDKKRTIGQVFEEVSFGERIDMEYWVKDMTGVLGPVLDA